MKVVIVGGGGREHALAWKIGSGERVSHVTCLPGNAGTALEKNTSNVPCNVGNVDVCSRTILALDPDLVVIGPELPLVNGLSDRLRDHGLAVVGPSRAAAALEGSKAFAKKVMERAGAPTGRALLCHSMHDVESALAEFGDDIPVIKADGLAAGKGVFVAETRDQAREAAHACLVEKRFGSAGEAVLVEERLCGVEASYIVLTDGERFVPLPTSQDYKRLLEGDRGPNTGGMGAYLPSPVMTPDMARRVDREIIDPVLQTIRELGLDYRGFLYAGLMITSAGPKVLEFNVRSGDPETQPILFGLVEDLVPCMQEVASGELSSETTCSAKPTAAVVLASQGYPGRYDVGHQIDGLDAVSQLDDVKVFHAGTVQGARGIETSGGRVLAVASRADTMDLALAKAYGAVDLIGFEGKYCRRDIGQ